MVDKNKEIDLPEDENITISFIKTNGERVDSITFYRGEINFLYKENSDVRHISRASDIDKISLFVTSYSGSDHLIDVLEGTLIIGDFVFEYIEPIENKDIFKLFIPITK